MSQGQRQAVRDVFETDEVREVLRERFYKPVAKTQPREKPDHYQVICISLYKEDLVRLDAKVKELKARGFRKMSRSALIRVALDELDLSAVPRGY